jgi:hypothetical protein
MGFRFQRRIKLFPGVRLNFSRGGISTTVGVRGASITFGPRGTYANAGLPGTGLSFRERIDHPAASEPRSQVAPQFDGSSGRGSYRGHTAQELELGAIRSAHVSAMTSAGLGELKKLINEAAARRIELVRQVGVDERGLRRARRRLTMARLFIIRLFTGSRIAGLTNAVAEAEAALDLTQRQLSGCKIEIDFAFDDRTLNTFGALIRSFDDLTHCARMWDITASVATNRRAERTIAVRSIERATIRLDFEQSNIIETGQRSLHLTNANGNDIYVYPGFVMVPSASNDFALIEFHDLQVLFSTSNFIEDDAVPSDAETVGTTWKKANKDGSRDRRFAENHQIPIVRYAEIEFRSGTGLWEVYQFSSYTRAHAFATAMTEYRQSVQALADQSKGTSAENLLSPVYGGDDAEMSGDHVSDEPRAVAEPAPLKGLVFDWVALAIIAGALVAGAALEFAK